MIGRFGIINILKKGLVQCPNSRLNLNLPSDLYSGVLSTFWLVNAIAHIFMYFFSSLQFPITTVTLKRMEIQFNRLKKKKKKKRKESKKSNLKKKIKKKLIFFWPLKGKTPFLTIVSGSNLVNILIINISIWLRQSFISLVHFIVVFVLIFFFFGLFVLFCFFIFILLIFFFSCESDRSKDDMIWFY